MISMAVASDKGYNLCACLTTLESYMLACFIEF
jgi:hypothetical protein